LMAGIIVSFSRMFVNIIFILFLLTHLSIIYFLFRYYQLKSK
jgi:hypothetical protein